VISMSTASTPSSEVPDINPTMRREQAGQRAWSAGMAKEIDKSVIVI